MDTMKVIENRRSIRKYKLDSVSDDKIRKMLEAARLAPSWCNSQPWRFIIVRDFKTKEKLSKSVKQGWIRTAPVIIVCCGDLRAWDHLQKRQEELGRKTHLIKEILKDPLSSERILEDPLSIEKMLKDLRVDSVIIEKELKIKRTTEQIAIAIENMLLVATDEGLGTCCIAGNLQPQQIRKLLSIPDHVVVSALVTVGYPDEEPEPRPRVELHKIVFQEKWREIVQT